MRVHPQASLPSVLVPVLVSMLVLTASTRGGEPRAVLVLMLAMVLLLLLVVVLLLLVTFRYALAIIILRCEKQPRNPGPTLVRRVRVQWSAVSGQGSGLSGEGSVAQGSEFHQCSFTLTLPYPTLSLPYPYPILTLPSPYPHPTLTLP